MADKKILIVIGIIVLLVIIALIVRSQKPSGQSQSIAIGSNHYTVEIADTLFSQAKGLSGRGSLESGHGMLFVFSSSSMQAFWMKDMQFPLDFIWINNGQVIGVTENVPASPPTAMYRPPTPVDRVLEVPAGTVARDGIKVGDMVL